MMLLTLINILVYLRIFQISKYLRLDESKCEWYKLNVLNGTKKLAAFELPFDTELIIYKICLESFQKLREKFY